MRKTKGIVLAWLMAFCMIVTICESTTVYATEVEEDGGTDENGFSVDNTGALIAYSGPGGDITIPSTVTTIVDNVFAGNTSLTSVNVPANVAVLGSGAFSNCTSLTSVTIYGAISTIPSQTFYNCQNLRSVVVPASITTIGAEAFASCVSLPGLTFPSGVANIGSKAFYNCTSLSGVSIPSAVSSIGSDAFTGCTSMTSYTVESGNGTYASANGCLYNKTLTKLLSCPEGKTSVAIADGTKIIGANAFYNCVGIRSLILPASITTIEANAFSGSGIRDVTILSGVKSIGAQGGWTADIIYGNSDSAAELYANSNSIVFQPLDTGSPDPDPTETETEPDTGNDTEKPGGNGGNNGNGNTGGSTNNNPSGGTSGGTSVSSGSTTSNVAAAASAHQKDATPKTGDGINPIFFFCIATLLVGVLLLAVGKKKTA